MPLQGSLITRSLITMEMTPFQKALSSLATQDLIKQDLPRCTFLSMQARTSRDPPTCTNLSMLVGSSPLLSTLRAPRSRAQVINGNMATSTTINSSPIKKFQAATREDVCPSLPVATMISPWAIMTSRWIMPTSTLGSPPSRRPSKTFRTCFTSTPCGKQKWETASRTSSYISSRKMRSRTTCSRNSTLTHHSDRLQ